MPPSAVDEQISNQGNEDVAANSLPSTGLVHDVSSENGVRKNMEPKDGNEYNTRTCLTTINLLAHILIGAVSGVALIFAFRNGLPVGATPIHISLCVLGYHLLMAEAILSLSSSNGWSSHLRLVDKRRAHYILQILGSGLAIVGSFIKILDKEEHWNTLHGQFALVALVFSSVSLVSGLASLWAYELRRFLPGVVSKLSHCCTGTVGYAAACIALCYGLEKSLFRNWLGDPIAYTMISFTATLGFIVILTPIASFYVKSRELMSRR